MLQVPVPVHREISRLPPVIRDLAFLVPVELELAAMLAQIEAARRTDPALAVLKHVMLFDEYRGKGLENKEKSLAFRFWLQDTQRTLSDAEADAAMTAVSAALSSTLGARLRSS
jgi:phenylalanyl-tRNA synthetase beta chain